MDARRSYYLASRKDDFAEPPAGVRIESFEILYAAPANDNWLGKSKLSVRYWKLFRRLVAGIGSTG